jgi:hypothetical protein
MNVTKQRTGGSEAIVLLVGLCMLSGTAAAQQPTAAQASAIRQACRSDYMANCSGVPTGGAAALQCLQQNAANVSPGCRQALQAASGSSPGTTAAAAAPARPAAAAGMASQPVSATWPHTYAGEGASAVVYQPQVISWPDRGTLNTRMAIAITPTGEKTPVLGTMQVSFATQTNLDTRYVTLSNAKLVSTQFPTLDTNRALRFENGISTALGTLDAKQVPLDAVLLNLRQTTGAPPAPPMKNDPPAIFRSERPASLVVFDGEPVLAPVGDTTIQVAVNTNWDVFFYGGTWYLLNNGGWLAAPAYRGPWAPAARLPGVFYTIPADANFAKVRAQIPGRTIAAADAPTIFVSTVPAEIIVTIGRPSFQRIPGTGLSYVSNTAADLFQDQPSGTFYYLVSGRWFSAPSLDGPWAFATASLPPGFAQIPPSGPRGSVLVSVPGTPQAQEALIQAQIPQQGTLSRSTAKLEVVYSGAPQFQPIAGTTMFYAVNTPHDVIRVGNVYYSCWQGAWFTAPSPTGVWVVADGVPEVIYTIPPSNPLYYVTYVRVYGSTSTTVTFGYTAGYTMGYVSTGVVVYGTGWYYPPYVFLAPVPVFYPYPYSFSGAVYYNSATGAWARGGTVYGPYGGAVTAGTAYNPATGAWAHGAAVYGPNGGAGAWSAYNPSTGSYAHGSASWGDGTGSANASWYNARTGVSGSTNQNYNQYGRWGSSQVSGPNQTVDTRSQSNAQGSAGGFRSTSGAEGAGVKGAGGNSAGVVKGPGGDVYAGADGNVYRHTSDGWQKYDEGSWNSVTPPAKGTSPGGAAPASQATDRPASQSTGSSQQRLGQGGEGAFGQRFANSASGQQLDQDRLARTQGDQRQQQFNQWREGGGDGSGQRFGGGRFAGGGGFAGRFGRR